MLFFGVFLAIISICLYDLTIAHKDLVTSSNNASPVARSLYPPGDVQTPDIHTYSTRRAKPVYTLAPAARSNYAWACNPDLRVRSLSSSRTTHIPTIWVVSTFASNHDFSMTLPFINQTRVSISLPTCLPHNPSLSPLGCREPSTSNSLSSIPTSAPISSIPPSQATETILKTILFTMTRQETMSPPYNRVLVTTVIKNEGRQIMVGTGEEKAVNQLIVQKFVSITSVLNSNGVLQAPRLHQHKKRNTLSSTTRAPS
ncbi:uncharacterized protein RSE6_14058 [Rhynchosporium secalis]|uniref:Uncharacterized protein n=1 Tax=Rhynchosporium secalis TaxID=38038 RepID=A0A1E1MUG9_RHYSE|nr:uncharacterized protein RSE6_14058 [Rhynchosporium secalis]